MSVTFNEKEVEVGLRKIIKALSKYVTYEKLTVKMLVKGYLEIRKDIKPEHFSELEVSLKEDRKNCEANFVFMVRIIIAISFFKATVPEFT